MDDDHASCHNNNNNNIGLGLGLSIGGYCSHAPSRQTQHNHEKKPLQLGLDLSFTLRPKDEAVSLEYKADRPRSSPRTSDEDEEAEVMNKRNHDHLNGMTNNNILRKKLRLTKEQSTLLEESFKLHSTLNPAQKQTLAEQLNLKPRQVEVWFQNRRARTKLKQTEVDCEYLKKCCERLSDENRRLKKELQELRSPEALYIQLPKAATLTVCPSCAGGGRPGERTSCGGSASEDQ